MARSRSRSHRPSAPVDASAASNPTQDAEVDRELQKIQSHLDAGSTADALHLAVRNASLAPVFANARAVCLLHAGKAAEAVRIYRGFALDSGGVSLRPNLPLTYKINFAIALAASGNAQGAANVLREIGAVQDERIDALWKSIAVWQKQLSILEWLQWKLGASIDRPVPVEPLPNVLTH